MNSPSGLRLLVTLSLLCACATAPKAPSTPAAQPPKAKEQPSEVKTLGPFEAAMTRESAPLPLVAVPFTEEGFSAEVEASAPPSVVPQPGFLQVTIPVGEEQPLTCFVYRKQIDAGASVARMLKLATSNPALKLQQVRPMEIVAVGTIPLLILHATYLAQLEGRPVAGLLKLAVYPARGGSAVCLQDEPGYAKTFSRRVQALAKTLKAPTTGPDPTARYEELSITRLGDLPVGFHRSRHFPSKSRGRVTETLGLMIMPRSPTDLIFTDRVRVDATDADGRVESMRIYESNAGEVELSLDVKRSGKNAYQYEGELSGKKVSGTFSSKDPEGLPGDERVEELLRTRMFDGKTTEHVHEQYDPQLSLDAPTELVMRPVKDAPRTLSLSLGVMTLRARVDDHGMTDRLEIPMGGVTLIEERLVRTGTP